MLFRIWRIFMSITFPPLFLSIFLTLLKLLIFIFPHYLLSLSLYISSCNFLLFLSLSTLFLFVPFCLSFFLSYCKNFLSFSLFLFPFFVFLFISFSISLYLFHLSLSLHIFLYLSLSFYILLDSLSGMAILLLKQPRACRSGR